LDVVLSAYIVTNVEQPESVSTGQSELSMMFPLVTLGRDDSVDEQRGQQPLGRPSQGLPGAAPV